MHEKKAGLIRPGDKVEVFAGRFEEVRKVRIIHTFLHSHLEPRVAVRIHWGMGSSWNEYGPNDLVPVGIHSVCRRSAQSKQRG